MRSQWLSMWRRNPYPPRHPERDIEDRIAAYFQGHADTLSVTRQMRFSDGSKADIVVESLLPDTLETRIITVIEVKAVRAGLSALEQLNRYLRNMSLLIAAEREHDGFEETVLAGMLAAPRFAPVIEEYAHNCGYSDIPFSIWRVSS